MSSKEELQQGLSTRIVGKKMFVFETIDSTNACARALGDAETAEGAVVIADFQTHGRGRMGRTWVSEPEANLLFSVLLRPAISVETSALLTLYASVAIARAVEHAVGEPIECKWPNDVMIRGKKFCGILLESSYQQSSIAYAVIGAGINVNQKDLPDEIAKRGTSLSLATGRQFDRKTMFQTVLGELDTMYDNAKHGDFRQIMTEWTERCSMFGKPVTVRQHNQVVSGTALKLNHDGGLVLDTGTDQMTVYAGDVTIVS